MPIAEPRYLSSEEAARLIGCCPNTLKNAANEGRLKCIRSAGPRRHWRLFEVEEINRWLLARPAWAQPRPGHVLQIAEDLTLAFVRRSELEPEAYPKVN